MGTCRIFKISIFNFHMHAGESSLAIGWFVLLASSLSHCSASPLRAANVAISLPLQGHYRPGRYMPIRISGQTDSAGDVLTLRARGALTAEIHPAENGRVDALLPWLSIVTVSDVRWSTSGSAGEHAVNLPLHALDEDDDRLIGYAGADADALAPLFPGKKLIRVELDSTDLLPGDITAWEALDGIVLDAGAYRRMTEGKVRSLLAGGTAIAIRSAQKPGSAWPWQRQGNYWIVQARIAGKASAYEDEIAYLPTQTWVGGWPFALRRKILLAAVVFVILATAVDPLAAGSCDGRWWSSWRSALLATGAGLLLGVSRPALSASSTSALVCRGPYRLHHPARPVDLRSCHACRRRFISLATSDPSRFRRIADQEDSLSVR